MSATTPQKETGVKAKLIEAEAKVARLEHRNGQLEALVSAARLLVGDLFKPCPRCGMRMATMDWNRRSLILCCNNSRCPSYRNPTGNIDKETLRALGVTLEGIHGG